ncbi:retrovirus-related pol polyprotein from transposon TNT 1-94 [Tanacetum coccineum]
MAAEVPQILEYMGDQLNVTLVLKDFQDSPDDEEDTRSSHEYLNDLEEEYQARALLVKSKSFFKKGTQRFSSAKATDQIECHKCGKKGYFARDCWSKTSVPSYKSPFQPKPISSSKHKPELRSTTDFEAKYNKIKAKLALLSSTIEVKVLMTLANEERVSVSKESVSNDEWVKISIQKCISEQIPTQNKKILGIIKLTEDTSSSGPKDPVFVKFSADNSDVSITGSNKPTLSEAEDFTLPNYDTATDYDSTNESSVYSTPLPLLEKLASAKPVSGPKTIKSNLKSNPTFKAKILKALAGKLKNVKIEDNPLLAIVMKELNELKLQLSKKKSSHSRNHRSQ